jgi:sulfate adenylyltransferase
MGPSASDGPVIPPAHGGRLIDRQLPAPEAERRAKELGELPSLHPSIDELYDLEKVGIGAYSPLEGFMDAATLESVERRGRLPNDLPFTIPILLAPPGEANRRVIESARVGDELVLRDAEERPIGLIQLDEQFGYDRGRLAESVYGTTDAKHPNVADLAQWGDTCLAGKVQLLQRLPLPAGRFELTPHETRELFHSKGWKTVVAYQCRNPPHVAHEYIQRLSLEREEVDGLLIHPVVGRLKKGDYKPEIILSAYEALVRNYYPPERVVLSALSIAMRYAGPKAALFLAIVRKNYGCSHYIVGRDQAGVGSYYDAYAAHRIFDQYDIGVTPLRYEESFFCRRCASMASPRTCAHSAADRVDTSQSRIRKALAEGGEIPPELLRAEVASILRRPNVLIEN